MKSHLYSILRSSSAKLLVILLVTTFASFRQARAEPSYLLDGSKFVSKTYGFAMPVPEGWGAEPITHESRVPVRFARPTGRAEAIVFVTAADSGQMQMPTAAEMESLSNKRFRGFQVTKMQESKLGGFPFRQYTATGSAGQRAYKVYAGQVGGQFFLVWMSSNQEAFAQAAAEFTQAIQQIQFEPKESPDGQPTKAEG